MKPPRLVFTSNAGMNREVGRLGGEIVGEINAVPAGTRGKFNWLSTPGHRIRKQGPAVSYEAARAAIAYEVEEWLIDIGWLECGERLEIVAPEMAGAR